VSPQGKKGNPAAAAKKQAPPPRRRPTALGLALFGGLLIALFVAVAVAQGIGHPSVPSDAIAVVEDAPDGTVTKDEFNRVLQQTAAGQGLKQVPAPSDPSYQQLADAAQANALLSRWVLGEADERGIEVSDREVEQQLQQIVQQQFGGKQSAFDKYVIDAGFCTDAEQKTKPLHCADVDKQVKLMIVSDHIQSDVLPDSPPVSDDEIKAYYDANVTQFKQPETRDVRVVLTKTQDDANAALAALQKDDSDDSWKTVAKKYSIDDATKSTGGLRQGVVAGQSEPALDKEIFSATQGNLVGPFKGDSGYYVIEVEKITPATTTSLSDATDQIKQTLVAAKQQEIAQTFQTNFQTKWTARTFCADGYRIERCANAEPVASTCTAEIAESQGCPAPVPSTKPIAPGTATVFGVAATPGLPQGPQTPTPEVPAGAGTTPGLTPVPGGTAPPGTAPPTGAPPPSGAPPQTAPPTGG
jgi:foldase protein PrsA